MPLFAARTRYSLVKGERIVRFVLTARLRGWGEPLISLIMHVLCNDFLAPFQCGTYNKKRT
jgi:hypothetical protein